MDLLEEPQDLPLCQPPRIQLFLVFQVFQQQIRWSLQRYHKNEQEKLTTHVCVNFIMLFCHKSNIRNAHVKVVSPIDLLDKLNSECSIMTYDWTNWPLIALLWLTTGQTDLFMAVSLPTARQIDLLVHCHNLPLEKFTSESSVISYYLSKGWRPPK